MANFKINNTDIKEYLGFEVCQVTIDDPEVNLITETVPFMNGSYDFTNIYGPTTYKDRIITIRVITENRTDIRRATLHEKYSMLRNFLLPLSQSKLELDYIEGYFLGRCTGISSKNGFELLGYIDIEFTCYPFRFMNKYEGDDLWDTFNFETGIAQETKFDINGTKAITLYNLGGNVIYPIIVITNASTSDIFKIEHNGKIYQFTSESVGTNKIKELPINIGINKMTITGKGTIEFKFKREVL